METATKKYVNGLPVPRLLIKLINEGRWIHHGKESIQRVVPFFKEEIVFLRTIEQMERQSKVNFEEMDWFYEKHSDRDSRAQSFPWRDLKLSFKIAVCESPGDDIAIALDFRTSGTNPKVIGNNWHRDNTGCPWEEISPTFEEFVKKIGIT